MYQYPYGNAQQLNLDWLMEQWQEVKQSIDGSLQGEIDRVEAAITDLLNARDAAVAASSAANTSAGAAASSANTAAAQAAIATAQAAAATQERINAANAANSAQTYAGNAQTQATAAGNYAGAASTSANQAAASASDAHDDALAAAGSASDAYNDAQAAAGSASDAHDDAVAAHDDAVAAQAILDSIPEDYSALAADVAANTAAIAAKPVCNYTGVINSQLNKSGSRTAQTGNNQSLLEIKGNYWTIHPTSETPSTTQNTVLYCPHNPDVAMQTTLTSISNQIVAQNAFLTLPSNATSLTIKCERIKHNAGTSYGAIYVLVYDSNDTQVASYNLDGGNAPQNATDYYDVIERALLISDKPELFANMKFAIVMARLWPFFNLEGQITLSVGTT